ncbi:MAG: zinc-ribbon domain-containing protein [Candidatus Binatia bacterium]|nr:zinc-ribbon domain-containing protein [Candidatus Binatia bacterium]
MTVQCPHCHTQYRVPESRLAGAQPVFKCTRCDLVFKSEPERADRSATRGNPDKNLSFDFPRKKRSREEPDEEGDPDEADTSEPAFVTTLGTGKRRRAGTARDAAEPEADEEEEELEFDDELVDEEVEEEEEEEEEEPPPPVIVAPKKRKASIRPRAPAPPRRRSPLKPIGTCVGMILCFYLLVAVALDRNPTDALAQLSEVPILGGLLGQDHLLVWRLEVTDLEGGLDYIRDHKLAYVVSGRAVNTTSQDLRIVEVEGGLVVGGQPTRSQRVYAANQARSTIRDLSASEVEMLLRLEPNRRFRIRPGESASFLLVFPDPPQGFEEVVVRIIDARVT